MKITAQFPSLVQAFQEKVVGLNCFYGSIMHTNYILRFLLAVLTSGLPMIWWCVIYNFYWRLLQWCFYFRYDLQLWRRMITRWLLIKWSYARSHWHILGWCLYFRYDLEWWRRRRTRWLLFTRFYTRSYRHILGRCMYLRYPDDLMM